MFLAMLIMTFGFMWVGVNVRGVGGGIAGFFIGAVLAGFLFSASDMEVPDGCDRYSSFAGDC